MKKRIKRGMFRKFFGSGAGSGKIILVCVVVSMIIANSPIGLAFQSLLDTPLGYQSEALQLRYSLLTWINDGLMALFFLLVGLEIKREMVAGELSTPKKALLPILCAIGGAITPSLIYLLFNSGLPTQSGWAIPMATDIAFAIAIISMLSKRVPVSLKIFLTALAIVDDLLAILIIALFYSGELHANYLLYTGGVMAFLGLMNIFRVRNLVFYLLPAVFLWYFVHHSGIHATLAGVLTAIFIPTAVKNGNGSLLEKLEHAMATPVNYIIVPVFALANTNITLNTEMVHGLSTPLGLGIILGLLIGKPLGILAVSVISVRTKIGDLPQNANWRHIVGVGLLAGIGFTMSIFISLLSFNDNDLISEAKFSILCGSILSAVIGYLFLARKDANRPS